MSNNANEILFKICYSMCYALALKLKKNTEELIPSLDKNCTHNMKSLDTFTLPFLFFGVLVRSKSLSKNILFAKKSIIIIFA